MKRLRWSALYGAALAAVPACMPAEPASGTAHEDAAVVDGAPFPRDPPEEPLTVSPDVVAARLARLIWNTENGADGSLPKLSSPLTRKGVGEAAAMMLRDPRARAGVAAFYRWWLLLDDLDWIVKEFAPETLDKALREAMKAEAPAVGAYMTVEEDASFESLLTGRFTFMNERLARHYGVSDVVGSEMRKVPFEREQRIGILSGAGVLTRFASLADPVWPAKRGWLIDDQLLCFVPIRSLTPQGPPDSSRSIRQQMIEATSRSDCARCHSRLNPPGFAFIGFDTFGRYRTAEAERPGETAGWISRDVLSDEPHFSGLHDLMNQLSQRSEVRRCFVSNWMRFATMPADGMPVVEDDAFRLSVERALQVFGAGGFRLRAAIVGVVQSDAFLRP